MKRVLSFLLALVLILGLIPAPQVQAAQVIDIPYVGAAGYRTMTTSQRMIDMMKVTEGFYAKAYWDNSQWTIGYGSFAGSYTYADRPSQTLTPAQAEQLLITQLRDGYNTPKGYVQGYETYVNNFFKKINRQPSQNQFDALVSLTYHVGPKWTTGSDLGTWLKSPTTDLDFLDTFGSWGVRSNGTLLYALMCRRIRETLVFCRGIYTVAYTPTSDHCMRTNLPVVPNGSLPFYGGVIYQYDYSTSKASKGNGHGVAYYAIGSKYTNLLTPTRSGYNFAGWKITKIDGKSVSGSRVTSATTVTDTVELTAQWTTSPVSGNPNGNSGTTVNKVPAVSGLPFLDINPSDWFVEDVRYVYNKDIMKGTETTLFSPNSSVTRAMLVTMLYRMDGSPSVSGSAGFQDVYSSDYYAKAVTWARKNGIVYGTTDTTFSPNVPVTRQQAVAIFYRYCCEYLKKSSGTSTSLSKFVDSYTLQSYAVAPMQWAVGKGVISGEEQAGYHYLNANGVLTRAQAAAILRRCAVNILGMK